jgi:hypothetical protein
MLRDQSNHRQPGSLRVASVNSRVISPLLHVLRLDPELDRDKDHFTLPVRM